MPHTMFLPTTGNTGRGTTAQDFREAFAATFLYRRGWEAIEEHTDEGERYIGIVVPRVADEGSFAWTLRRTLFGVVAEADPATSDDEIGPFPTAEDAMAAVRKAEASGA